MDALARDLASGQISRRTALKRALGGAAAVAVPSALLADPALAKCPPSRKCGSKCCPSGMKCKKGRCKCKKGTTKCGKKCIDTQTDPANCGSCGHACTSGQTCTAGTCTGGGNPTGGCTTAADCPQGAAGDCKKAVCESGVCGFANDDSDVADDGNPCTIDTCSGGSVVHSPVAQGQTCGTGLVCNGSGQCVGCNSASDCPAPSSACQIATCSSGTCGFANVTDGLGCNDGNLCTTGDHCQSGTCVPGTPVTCTAQDQCHVAGTCNPATGVCSNPAKADGSACDDGNLCTTGDVCMSGVCQAGSPVNCAASDACHLAGTCNPATGICSNPLAPDGTPCVGLGATCQGGVCICIPQPAATVCGLQTCGTAPDGCGGMVSCGPDCPPGTTCMVFMCA